MICFSARPKFLSILIFLLTGSLSFGEGTRTWEQSKFDDLIKGTARGIAIRSIGGLELAPDFKALATTPSTYIWAIASGANGEVYAAAGSPARVYRITPDGKSTVIFEPQELQVQALAVARDGSLYAATNPDGKIYRIKRERGGKRSASDSKSGSDPEWQSSVYFDPGTKYIWDLVLGEQGDLFVATGDHGEIFRVNAKGEHAVFFKSDEVHIRVMELDSAGNLIAGSVGSGLIYRISPEGEAFVLYSAPKKEITALAIDSAGNIYAAGAGEKHASTTTAMPLALPMIAPLTTTGSSGKATELSNSPSSPSSSLSSLGINLGSVAAGNPAGSGGSDIYRIAPDGAPTRIWTSHEDLVYALAFDSNGRLIAGTGNRGHIFAVNGEDDYSDLIQASASQVTAFAKAPDGGIYVATSNLGKLFLLSAKSAASGDYQSDVFDAHNFSKWGRAEFRGAGNVELFTRSGNVDNPDRNWSAWKSVDLSKDGETDIPPARFAQWKAILKSGDPPARVDSVALNYLPKNVAPDFDDVWIQPGVKYQAPTKLDDESKSDRSDGSPTIIHDRTSIGVRWTVHDDNNDEMVYSIYYRADDDQQWFLLKDNLTEKFYSFDALLLPDGGYKVKVVASDAPSHAPGQNLTASRESARFEVDTTAPRIDGIQSSLNAGKSVHVTFRAVDSFSAIKKAEYSLDAGDWQFISPVNQISDSKTESYDFEIPLPALERPASEDHVVVVRVYDRHENMSSAKTMLRGKP